MVASANVSTSDLASFEPLRYVDYARWRAVLETSSFWLISTLSMTRDKSNAFEGAPQQRIAELIKVDPQFHNVRALLGLIP